MNIEIYQAVIEKATEAVLAVEIAKTVGLSEKSLSYALGYAQAWDEAVQLFDPSVDGDYQQSQEMLWATRSVMAEHALEALQSWQKTLLAGNTDEQGNHSPEFWDAVPPYPTELLEVIRVELEPVILPDHEGVLSELAYVCALCQTEQGPCVIAIEHIENDNLRDQNGVLMRSDHFGWDPSLAQDAVVSDPTLNL